MKLVRLIGFIGKQSITDTLRNQLLTASNSALFTPGDFKNGKVQVQVYDYRFLNLANANSSSSQHQPLQYQQQQPPQHQLIPSIVEFELRETEGAVCQAILDLIAREPDPATRDRLLRHAAEIEARILVETEPNLCLDPSPEVERQATLKAYNESKYNVPVPPLAYRAIISAPPPHAPTAVVSATSPDIPHTKHNKSPPLSSSKPSSSSSSSKIPSSSVTEDRKDAKTNSLQQQKVHRLLLVSDLTNGGATGSHGLMREGDGAGGSGNANASAGAGVSGSSGFQPRFSRLQFIEEYRKRKRNFDSEIMLGLDTRRKMQKSEKKAAANEPEYAALNGMKVIRTVRFEQSLTQGTVYTILNIVETGVPDEYEAILRIGNEAGNSSGPFSTTLRYNKDLFPYTAFYLLVFFFGMCADRYPVGNIMAVDNYLGYFKSFYSLTNKMTGVLVTVSNNAPGGVSGTSLQGTMQ
ncbi:UNVERIFIED_CONTAM: hypothetical protein HDU68_010695 [Siphonaria sp. JEL0065]|nr:hypothetical protein HDU68_010695 [Siphonaria sp. JEL0065]